MDDVAQTPEWTRGEWQEATQEWIRGLGTTVLGRARYVTSDREIAEAAEEFTDMVMLVAGGISEKRRVAEESLALRRVGPPVELKEVSVRDYSVRDDSARYADLFHAGRYRVDGPPMDLEECWCPDCVTSDQNVIGVRGACALCGAELWRCVQV